MDNKIINEGKEDRSEISSKKSSKTRSKAYTPTFIVSLLLFVFGILVMLYTPLNRTPDYEDLQEKEVTVQSFNIVRHRKSSDDAILTSTDGIKYYVVGNYDKDDLENLISNGDKVKVRYYERKSFYIHKINCACEVSKGSEVVCTYKNNDSGNTIALFVVGGLMITISVVLLLSWRKSIKANR